MPAGEEARARRLQAGEPTAGGEEVGKKLRTEGTQKKGPIPKGTSSTHGWLLSSMIIFWGGVGVKKRNCSGPTDKKLKLHLFWGFDEKLDV